MKPSQHRVQGAHYSPKVCLGRLCPGHGHERRLHCQECRLESPRETMPPILQPESRDGMLEYMSVRSELPTYTMPRQCSSASRCLNHRSYDDIGTRNPSSTPDVYFIKQSWGSLCEVLLHCDRHARQDRFSESRCHSTHCASRRCERPKLHSLDPYLFRWQGQPRIRRLLGASQHTRSTTPSPHSECHEWTPPLRDPSSD